MIEKVKSMEACQKLCVVMFDEMSFRKELSYCRQSDSVDGLVELPDKQNEICTQALVFMARGVAANWKQPLGFFYSSNAAPAHCLHDLLLTVLKRLCDIDLSPVAVISDQASTNRQLFTGLGLTATKPYFEVGSQIKLWMLF